MAEGREQRPRWNSLTPTQQQALPPQTQEYRLTGPYGRMVQHPETKAWRTVEYAKGDMITPTWEERDAHPDLFEEWPPAGTVLAHEKPAEETPPEETPAARSRR